MNYTQYRCISVRVEQVQRAVGHLSFSRSIRIVHLCDAAGKVTFDAVSPSKSYSSIIQFGAAKNCAIVNLGHKLCVLKAVKAGQMGENLEQHTEQVQSPPSHFMHYFTTFDTNSAGK